MDLPALDVTYFTSLSYYILLLFGLRGVLTLIFRDATIDETQMYRQQMGMGGGSGGPLGAMANPDPNKAFEAERAALELVRPRCPGPGPRSCLASSGLPTCRGSRSLNPHRLGVRSWALSFHRRLALPFPSLLLRVASPEHIATRACAALHACCMCSGKEQRC